MSSSYKSDDADAESKRGLDLFEVPPLEVDNQGYIGPEDDTLSIGTSDLGLCLEDTFDSDCSQKKTNNCTQESSIDEEDLLLSEVYSDPDREEAERQDKENYKSCALAKEDPSYSHKDNCICHPDYKNSKDQRNTSSIDDKVDSERELHLLHVSNVQDEEISFSNNVSSVKNFYDEAEVNKEQEDNDDDWIDYDEPEIDLSEIDFASLVPRVLIHDPLPCGCRPFSFVWSNEC